METTRRLVLKSLTWQALGLLTMTAIGWLVTGSPLQASGIALAGMATGVVAYILHEKLWARVDWGRLPAPPRRRHP